ncbi:MAG: C_GCAxxG_C_C family protein [Deltaproteobacteria bacterium]|nr:C_GCAxxG_C_C family protein [Deltaproteobacteria bacterium]
MTEKAKDRAEKAFESAMNYEKRCTGCAQTCIAGIFDALDIENDDVFRSASGLADGLGLTGDGSCGALTGGAMVIGLLFGREKKDIADMMKPMRSYLLVKKLHDRFVERYGTCRCYDVQRSLMGRTFNLYDPAELEAALRAGMIGHCSRLVGEAARMATEIILSEWEMEKDT